MTTAPPLSEAEFLSQVTDLADIMGFAWLHLRPGMTRDSWRTPISGPLGRGFPDLLLIRPGRIIFAELKRAGGKPTPDQAILLAALKDWGFEAYLWEPKDMDEIQRVLK